MKLAFYKTFGIDLSCYRRSFRLWQHALLLVRHRHVHVAWKIEIRLRLPYHREQANAASTGNVRSYYYVTAQSVSLLTGERKLVSETTTTALALAVNPLELERIPVLRRKPDNVQGLKFIVREGGETDVR